jgi:hypothetical protein
MSLFDNIYLLKELLKIGQVNSPNTSEQYTQQTPNFDNIKKLIANLEKNLNHSSHQVSHEGPQNTKISLRMDDLNSLGNLANWLETNKVIIDGQRIVYSEAENPNNESYVLYHLNSTPGSIQGEVDRSKPYLGAKDTFVINKDLLSKYLISLQNGLHKNNNQIEKILVSSLIQQSNNLLDTNINPNKTNHNSHQDHQVGDQIGDVKNQGKSQNKDRVNQGNQEADTSQLLSELSQMQPFNTQYVNTEGLKDFADKYGQLASNDSAVQTMVNQINQSINIADKLMQSPGAPIAMNLDLAQFEMQTSQPQQLASALWSVVSMTQRLYQKCIIQFQGKVNDSNIRAMKQQIPVAQTNLNDLAQLLNQAKQEWDKNHKGFR